MCIDWAATSPTLDDQIDPLPQWKAYIVSARDVIEQAHPKCGQRFVVETGDAVMSGERANIAAHSFEGLNWRQLRKVTHGHRDVGNVSEFRSRNRRRLKRFDQRCDFGIACKVLRLQFRAGRRTSYKG